MTQISRLVDNSWRADRLEIGWADPSEFHGQGYAGEIGHEGLAFAKLDRPLLFLVAEEYN